VIGFEEKGHAGPGLINAGICIQRRAPLSAFGPEPFSFESDYLAKLNPAWPIQGQVGEGYFIDMGIPTDLEQARKDFMSQ
jgi:D-glycero-alpha-D-manno-heptose 1-phosphate guanylyltransferase